MQRLTSKERLKQLVSRALEEQYAISIYSTEGLEAEKLTDLGQILELVLDIDDIVTLKMWKYVEGWSEEGVIILCMGNGPEYDIVIDHTCNLVFHRICS